MSESKNRTGWAALVSATAGLFIAIVSTTQPAFGADGVSTEAYAKKIVDLVNRERYAHRREALRPNKALSEAAQKRAAEIAVKYSHTRPDDREFWTALDDKDVFYRIAEENIGRSSRQTTPEAIMKVWMDSELQRDNILRPQFQRIGVGVVTGSKGELYWVQLFTEP